MPCSGTALLRQYRLRGRQMTNDDNDIFFQHKQHSPLLPGSLNSPPSPNGLHPGLVYPRVAPGLLRARALRARALVLVVLVPMGGKGKTVSQRGSGRP